MSRSLFWLADEAWQAIGRSRGGWTTKVYALTDVLG